MSSMSLKPSQLAAVHRMLAFNEKAQDMDEGDGAYSLPPAGSSHNQWKILIYDTPCRSIISPLLSVSQLRRRGVTLHLLLESEREAIPDVPAVYFIRPTRENLQIVAKDCAKGLYEKVHLNFCTKLDRSLMEEFAQLVVQSGSLDKIASVHDQYLDYVCLEKDLFSLYKPNSYITINGSNATDAIIEEAMNEIAYGLFSVVATLGQIPIIRCPTAGAPEMVARKLNRMIAEHPTLLRGKNTSAHHRPLLVILDRNSDLVTPLQHTSTYQALIDDLLSHRANRVEFSVKEEGKKPIVKKFDLDPDEDPFYVAHKFQPFPEAIESNGVELEQVTTREQEIRSKTGGAVTAAVVQHHEPGSSTTDLATAVDSLPALLEQKKKLEIHTSILQAVMNEVAARDVPQFYELESSLATGAFKNDLGKAKQEVAALATSKGSVQDKVRLIATYCLATKAPSSDIDEVVAAMKEALETPSGNSTGLDKESRKQLETGVQGIEYIKRLRSMHMISTMSEMQEISGNPTSTQSDMLSSFMKSATNQATGLLAKATEKVGTMLGKIHKHPATRVVENLCDMKPNSEDDDYLYLDPKVKGDVKVAALRGSTPRAPVSKVICFMIGGGSYAEYQNLQMVASDRRTVSYGSTELVDASDFLSQLGQLA